ncbi:hypothetical protein GCM10009651_35710 [Microbacterium natoriense]
MPGEDSAPYVKVSLDLIYTELMAVKADVAEMKAASTAAIVADHEGRIRTLEKWVWGASGIAAVGGAGLSQLITALMR